MEHNVKPSEVMRPFPPRPPPLPLLALQARRKIAEARAEADTLDQFIEGYITAFLEQGFNYSQILKKCSEKGYDVSKRTIDEFMKAIKQNTDFNRPDRRKSSDDDDNFSEDSESQRKVTCFEVVSRGVITTLNLLFFLVSAVMIALGCLIKYGSANLLRYLEPLFDSIQQISEAKHYPLGHISITHLILEAATATIVIGVILMFIAWFGWCGALCRKRTMLVVYACILTMILALQVTVIVVLVVMRARVDLALKKPWKDTLLTQYEGIQGQDSISVSWNYIMNSLECCGVDGAEDFDKSRNWDRIYHDPHTMRSVHLSIPMICCKNLGDYPNINPPRNFTCAIAPDRYTSNYKTGCYNELWNYISRAELSLACVMMVATIIQMLLIFASVYLIARIDPELKDDDDDDE